VWSTEHLGAPTRLGDLAGHLAVYSPAVVKANAGWTDKQIHQVVIALIEAEFGLERAKFTLDSSFVEDMHVD
jgi:hypothetical protein